MSKTVFILGAGASYTAGVPLMNGFLDRAREIWKRNELQPEDESHFDKVFKGISHLQKIHSKSKLDINNLESVFATFEMANRLEKMPGFEDEEISDLIHSLRRLIVVTIEKSLKFPLSDGYLNLPKPYDKFGTLLSNLKNVTIPEQDVSILTFNYDLAIDITLHNKRLGGPDYCLPNSLSSDADRIKLLKLHGSLNWGITEKAERVRPWELNRFTENKAFFGSQDNALITVGSELQDHDQVDYKEDPVIIPPTWNKSNFHSDLNEVWIQAAKELEEAENLFVIGFSLPETDIFFRHLYALGTVGDIPFNKFWVFDPDDKGIVKKRYENLLGPGAKSRFKFFPKKFNEAVNVIGDSFTHRK